MGFLLLLVPPGITAERVVDCPKLKRPFLPFHLTISFSIFTIRLKYGLRMSCGEEKDDMKFPNSQRYYTYYTHVSIPAHLGGFQNVKVDLYISRFLSP